MSNTNLWKKLCLAGVATSLLAVAAPLAGAQNHVADAATTKTVIDKTVTYDKNSWPGSRLASGTKTVKVPYKKNYSRNWTNITKYFYQYLNELSALNGAPSAVQDAPMMGYAQKRADAQKSGSLSHDGSDGFFENLAFMPNGNSDQEIGYAMVMQWFDESNNVYPVGKAGHWGHRANLLYARGITGIGWNRKGGQISYDATEPGSDKVYDLFNLAGPDKTSVGLPKTVFSYYHTATVGVVNSDIAYTGVATMKRAASMYTRKADNTFSKAKSLKKNSAWKISRVAVIDGTSYYCIGGKSYVRASDVSLRRYGTAHVNYNKHYGIQIWTAKHTTVKNPNGTAKKLPGQTNWKVYGKATIQGQTYYNLGGDQYIDAHYVTVR
jgi:uncharacterized protein YkwD